MEKAFPGDEQFLTVTLNSEYRKIPQSDMLRNHLSDLVTISPNQAYCVTKFRPHKILVSDSSALRISKRVAFRFHQFCNKKRNLYISRSTKKRDVFISEGLKRVSTEVLPPLPQMCAMSFTRKAGVYSGSPSHSSKQGNALNLLPFYTQHRWHLDVYPGAKFTATLSCRSDLHSGKNGLRHDGMKPECQKLIVFNTTFSLSRSCFKYIHFYTCLKLKQL